MYFIKLAVFCAVLFQICSAKSIFVEDDFETTTSTSTSTIGTTTKTTTPSTEPNLFDELSKRFNIVKMMKNPVFSKLSESIKTISIIEFDDEKNATMDNILPGLMKLLEKTLSEPEAEKHRNKRQAYGGAVQSQQLLNYGQPMAPVQTLRQPSNAYSQQTGPVSSASGLSQSSSYGSNSVQVQSSNYGTSAMTHDPVLDLENTCPVGFVQPIWTSDKITATYCRCPSNTYGISCTENFKNPCADNEQQYFPADQSLGKTYFIECSNQTPYLFQCPANLEWNQSILTCDYPESFYAEFKKFIDDYNEKNGIKVDTQKLPYQVVTPSTIINEVQAPVTTQQSYQAYQQVTQPSFVMQNQPQYQGYQQQVIIPTTTQATFVRKTPSLPVQPQYQSYQQIIPTTTPATFLRETPSLPVQPQYQSYQQIIPTTTQATFLRETPSLPVQPQYQSYQHQVFVPTTTPATLIREVPSLPVQPQYQNYQQQFQPLNRLPSNY